MERQFEAIEPNVWKPISIGEKLTGVLVSVKQDTGAHNSILYNIENKEGMFKVWGSTVLNDRMQYVKIGEVVRITFKGQETNKKGQPVKIWKVEKEKKAKSKIEYDYEGVKQEQIIEADY